MMKAFFFFHRLHSQSCSLGTKLAANQKQKGIGSVLFSIFVFIASYIDTTTFNLLITCFSGIVQL